MPSMITPYSPESRAAAYDAAQCDLADLALGRIVRVFLAAKRRRIAADPHPAERQPDADIVTPERLRTQLRAILATAEQAGLDPDRAREVGTIAEQEFTWSFGSFGNVRLDEINERLRR